jgi:polyferredoxin
MRDPLNNLDLWASQSVDRATLLMWLVVIAFGLVVALAVMAEVWYTAPPPPLSHVTPPRQTSAPA